MSTAMQSLSRAELQNLCRENSSIVDIDCRKSNTEIIAALTKAGVKITKGAKNESNDDSDKKSNSKSKNKKTSDNVDISFNTHWGPSNRVGEIRKVCEDNKEEIEKLLGRSIDCSDRKLELVKKFEEINEKVTDKVIKPKEEVPFNTHWKPANKVGEIRQVCIDNKAEIEKVVGHTVDCEIIKSGLIKLFNEYNEKNVPDKDSGFIVKKAYKGMKIDKGIKIDKGKDKESNEEKDKGEDQVKSGSTLRTDWKAKDTYKALIDNCMDNKDEIEKILGRTVDCNAHKYVLQKMFIDIADKKKVETVQEDIENRSKNIKSVPDPKKDYSEREDMFNTPKGYDSLFDEKNLVLNSIDISALICSKLTGHNYEETLKTVKQCEELAKCTVCTPLAQKMAYSLIRIASQRIFADPEQSILELIVNSIDAYRPKERIGKFGLGFFSILYWLIEHPKRRLIIYSFEKEQSYKAIIQEKTGYLTLTLQYAIKSIGRTGTMIYLDASDDNFSSVEIANFYSQLSKVVYKEGVAIYAFVNYLGYNNAHNLAKPKPSTKDIELPIVYFSLANYMIINEDYATGISLPVLINSLLIPTISTKTLKLQPGIGSYVPRAEINKSKKPSFTILVSGIAVVKISLDHRTNFDYVIWLPPNTKLPVSRDDVIIDKDNEQYFEKSLNMLLNKAFENPKHYGSILNIQDLLTKYITFTRIEENKHIIKRVTSKFYTDNAKFLVPSHMVGIYRKISDKFFASNVYDIWQIKSTIDELATQVLENVWYGKKILVMDIGNGLTISSIGIPSYLVVSSEYIKSNTDWAQKLAISFQEEKLIVIGGKVGDILRTKFSELVPKKLLKEKNSEADVELFYETMARFEATSIYWENVENKTNNFAKLLKYLLVLKRKDWRDCCIAFINRFSKLTGNTQYGGQRYSLTRIVLPSKEHNIKKLQIPDKIYSYMVESFINIIISIEEQIYININLFISQSIISLYQKVPNFLKQLLEDLAPNAIYYTILANILKNETSSTTNSDPNIYVPIIKRLIEIFNGEGLIDWSIMHYIYKENSINFVFYQTLNNVFNNWKNITINQLTLPERTIEHPKGMKKDSTQSAYLEFYSSQLINYIFKHDVDRNSTLNDIVTDINKSNETASDLQVLEIAINEGTTKSPIEASITELVQNSVDAIRSKRIITPQVIPIVGNVTTVPVSTGPTLSAKTPVVTKPNGAISSPLSSILLPNIDIDVFTIKDSPGKLGITITDYVGFSEWIYIYLSIPFLSTKKPSDEATGEMGSGFFNVYRNTETVIIDTVENGTRIYSIDTPEYNDKVKDKVKDKVNSGRVMDIKKKVLVEQTKEQNRTKITMIFPVKILYEVIADISFQVRTIIGLIDPTLANIYLNGSIINISKTLYYEDSQYEIFSIGDESGNGSYVQSYILTKVIPFAPLESMISSSIRLGTIGTQNLNTGVVINIKSGGYTPVQTRTRIKLTSESEANFNSILERAAFISAITKFKINNIQAQISHYLSSADPRQLRFTQQYSGYYSRPSELLTYYEFLPNVNFAKLVNLGIEIMGDKPYQAVDTALKAMLKEQLANIKIDAEKSFIEGMVVGWFVSKNLQTVSGVKTTKSVSSKLVSIDQDIDNEYPEFNEFLQKWVTTYIEIGTKLKLTGFNTNMVKKVVLVKGKSNDSYASGWFNLSDSVLAISTKFWSTKNIKTTINQLLDVWKKKITTEEKIEEIKNNALWKTHFSVIYPASVVIHEIEHARRRIDGHDNYIGSLYPGDSNMSRSGPIRNFEQCANTIYQKIIEGGFYDKL